MATVFDGRIYTVGGATALVEFQTVGAVATNVVEVYDPSTNSWSEAAPTPFGHVYANGVSVIDGKLYLPGGAGCDAPGCGGSTALYIFDPADGPLGSWTLGPSMPIPIHGGTGGAINGKLYVLAGWSVGAPRNRFFRFDPATSEWTELAPSPHGHTFGASAVLDDRFYATGAEGITSFLDIYDPATDTWTSRVMPVGYQHHSAIALNGRLFLVAGYQFINENFNGDFNIAMAYDPGSDSWTTRSPEPNAGGPYVGNAGSPMLFGASSSITLSAFPTLLNLPAGVALGGALYVMGGTTQTDVLNTVLRVDPPGTAALSYNWDFGDGSTGTGANPTHTYASPGDYTATVTVSTDDGRNGVASAPVSVGPSLLTPSGSAAVWMGLKSSDDVGTMFDVRTEILRNGNVIAAGELDGVSGGSSGFNNAIRRTIDASLALVPTLGPGDQLGVRLLVRIAQGVPGHRAGTARLWYNDASADSRVSITLNGALQTYYLRAGFALSTSAGGGPRSTVDVSVDRLANGNAFKPFGTWVLSF